MSCAKCGANCFGTICARCKGEVTRSSLHAAPTNKDKLLKELMDACTPIVEWHKKLAACSSGCALPSEPEDWQWLRLHEALRQAKRALHW